MTIKTFRRLTGPTQDGWVGPRAPRHALIQRRDMLPKSSSLNSIRDAQEAGEKLDAIISSRVIGSLAVAERGDEPRPSTPEPHVETEKEREARRERRRLRRARKEAEEAATNRSPRRETNPEKPDKERIKAALGRSSSVRVAPAKPLPPLPEGTSAHSCAFHRLYSPVRPCMQAPQSIVPVAGHILY